jgi:hypothetical protein
MSLLAVNNSYSLDCLQSLHDLHKSMMPNKQSVQIHCSVTKNFLQFNVDLKWVLPCKIWILCTSTVLLLSDPKHLNHPSFNYEARIEMKNNDAVAYESGT